MSLNGSAFGCVLAVVLLHRVRQRDNRILFAALEHEYIGKALAEQVLSPYTT